MTGKHGTQLVADSRLAHEHVRELMIELQGIDLDEVEFEVKFHELMGIVREHVAEDSNNSPLPLIVTLTSFGCRSPEFKGIRNFICVYQIIALTHLTPFYQMQRPFREKKHSALGNPFSVEVSFHVSA